MESMGTRSLLPSTRNSGQIRSSTVRMFSCTIRRDHSVRRLRRGRTPRSSRPDLISPGAGAERGRLSGRANLIAMRGLLASFFSLPGPSSTPGKTPRKPVDLLLCGGAFDPTLKRLYRCKAPAPAINPPIAPLKPRTMTDQPQRRPTRPSDLLEPVRLARAVRGSWTDYLVLFLRLMAGVSLVKGVYHWGQGCGIGAPPRQGFESHTIAWQTTTVFFAVLDLVAAVGLWLAAAWGAVLWLASVVSMAAVEVFFPQVYGGSLFVVFAEITLLGAYLFLAIAAARERAT